MYIYTYIPIYIYIITYIYTYTCIYIHIKVGGTNDTMTLPLGQSIAFGYPRRHSTGRRSVPKIKKGVTPSQSPKQMRQLVKYHQGFH